MPIGSAGGASGILETKMGLSAKSRTGVNPGPQSLAFCTEQDFQNSGAETFSKKSSEPSKT